MTKKWFALLSLLLVAALFCVPAPAPVKAVVEYTEIYVDSTLDINDTIDNDVCSAGSATGGPCTLRAAITNANWCATQFHDCGEYITIYVPAGTYFLTITGADENDNASGDLDLIGWYDATVPTTIQGAGAELTIIDGNHIDRVFHTVYDKNNVQIRDLTVRGGYREQTGTEWELGGGILHNLGSMKLENVILDENTVACTAPSSCHQSRGGGIFASDTLIINTSTIRNNTAYFGGGIATNSTPEIKIYHSTLSGNWANTAGAYLGYGSSYFYNSTISGNISTSNGAMFNSEGTMKLVNVTLSSNISGNSNANLINSGESAHTRLKNTIIANPIRLGAGAVDNCYLTSGTLQTDGYNMSDDDTCNLSIGMADFPNTEPMLAPLAGFGGPTQTHGLLAGSPAHNAKSGFCTDYDGGTGTVTVDQRGSNRDSQCDIGAFEGVAYNFFLPMIKK